MSDRLLSPAPAQAVQRARSGHQPAARIPQRVAQGIGRMQRVVGNQTVYRLFRSSGIQPKLTVNRPGDEFEREADRVADQVMRMPAGKPEIQRVVRRVQRKCAACEAAHHEADASGHVARKCATCEAEEEEGDSHKHVQAKRDSVGAPGIRSVDTYLNRHRGGGRSLDRAVRTDLEARFGRSFERVRIHDGAAAAASARSIDARAYTFGSDIVFGAGEFAPATTAGRLLLAHELTHVVQQGGAAGPGVPPTTESSAVQTDRPAIQRSANAGVMRAQLFDSTLKICHRVLTSRTFRVRQGGVIVSTNAGWVPTDEWEGEEPPQCGEESFHITLMQKGWLRDRGYGDCEFGFGEDRRTWGNVPADEYYLTIWKNSTHPYCCLEGTIEVSEDNVTGETCTELPPGALEMLHDALSVAGLIPALGAIPDAIDTGIYVIQGDWTSAGLSAIAIIPIFGDAASVGRIGARTVVRVTEDGVKRIGKSRLAARLRQARELLRRLRVPRAVPYRGAASRLDPELVRRAKDIRATQTGITREAFESYNVATARVRVDGQIQYLEAGNLPGGPHSEEWLHTQVSSLKRGHREVVVEQLYSERIPCRTNCGPLLSHHYPNADVFYSTSANSPAGRVDDLMAQYGVGSQ